MSVRYEDLPAAVRARIDAQDTTERRTPAPRASGERPTKGWRCHTCGAHFTAWATVQRHMDEAHGGGRIEMVL